MFSKLVGEIESIRIENDHHYCHVKFYQTHCVETALKLNDWWVKMSLNQSIGQLYLDFSDNREDQYTHEVHHRKMKRQRRHKNAKRIEKQN